MNQISFETMPNSLCTLSTCPITFHPDNFPGGHQVQSKVRSTWPSERDPSDSLELKFVESE